MAKVNLQCSANKSDGKDTAVSGFKGPVDVLKKAFNDNGVSGMYKGMQTQIMKAVLCQAILSMSKERLVHYFKTDW